MAIKAKTIRYSQDKNKVKRVLKESIRLKIARIEENALPLQEDIADQYNYLIQKLKQIEEQEIEGYRTRIKYLPTHEKGEADIAFYSKLEERKIAKNSIGQLAEKMNGQIYTDNENLIRISNTFYSELYTPTKVKLKKQHKLLSNIKKKITEEQKAKLDATLTPDELREAVFSMQKGKSPGLDGIPVEFYQEYWESIKLIYFNFISKVKTEAFSKTKNTSVIKLIYKKKGEVFLLINYRPISLINVDIKILTKALANRLKYILPSIIHESQTAVYGRKIDQTIHKIRDLIDIANQEDEPAAFIFLDQEKAFDRVDHDFLYKTMRAFGIGDIFIQWVNMIYSNASAVVDVNGFLSKQIPLNRGVRQGCPLSALLYVLIIEVLAIQLRINPNIVGFRIGEEKFVSAHYLDEATIIIKQNRCFKEVIKELSEYEESTGAKVNYQKTKGLWAGAWKGRRVSPMNIKWTSKNVENLGVFFGNDNPALETYSKIIPNVIKRFNYWKQFKLTQIGKARVVEIFLASKLLYATRFYPIPAIMQKNMQKAIYDFVTFPSKVKTISQHEMWKTKQNGGIKLINLEIKSGSAKAKWLIEIATRKELKSNLAIFTRLLGQQEGNITGRDLVFLQKSYFQKHLNTRSVFYKEGLLSLGKLEIRKGIKTLKHWDEEHIFFNPLLTTTNGKTINSNPYCKKHEIYKYEQLIEEKRKDLASLPFDKTLTKLLDKILILTHARKNDVFIAVNGEESDLAQTTQKLLYEQTLLRVNNYDHHSQAKIFHKLQSVIIWEDVWNSVHNMLSSNETKTAIWQQIHLNFYTQYSYNKWHKVHENCPLCLLVPQNIFHITLDCNVTNLVWEKIKPTLMKLETVQISEDEKILGIAKKTHTDGSLLRNWITYMLRFLIMEEEKIAYHTGSIPKTNTFLQKFNRLVHFELQKKIA